LVSVTLVGVVFVMATSAGVVVVRRVAALAWLVTMALTRSSVDSEAVVSGRVVRMATALIAPPPRRTGLGVWLVAIPGGVRMRTLRLSAGVLADAAATCAESVAVGSGAVAIAVAVAGGSWMLADTEMGGTAAVLVVAFAARVAMSAGSGAAAVAVAIGAVIVTAPPVVMMTAGAGALADAPAAG
jgi:hypothetical protein